MIDEFDFSDEDNFSLVAQGQEAATARHDYHFKYEQALAEQQAVRAELRARARKVLGTCDRHGDFKKTDKVRIGYESRSKFNLRDDNYGSWYVLRDGHDPVGAFTSKADAAVGAYLVLQGFDPRAALAGAEV